MSENENVQAEVEQEAPNEESHDESKGTDWKAEARKWEKRAKENTAAAEELAALKAESMSEAEKLQLRADKAEAELSELKAAAQREAAAKTLSKEHDVPQELLMYCADEEQMASFAEKYKELNTTNVAPKAKGSRISRGVPNAEQENRDRFAEIMAQELQKGM